MADHGHFLQLYEDETHLFEAVSHFVGSGLQAGDAVVVIARKPYGQGVEERLRSRGLDLQPASQRGQYVALDAAEMLSQIMVDGCPEPARFVDLVGRELERASAGGRRVRAFGELVALLCAQANKEAAVRLEQLWNDLAKAHSFSLLCGYPMSAFQRHADTALFWKVCAAHSRVIPAESYTSLAREDDRLRAVGALQQKANALEAEIAERVELAKSLQWREKELSDFLESAVEGLQSVGPDGVIQWANKAQLRLLGYTADEYIGHHFSEFHAHRECVDEIWTTLLRGDNLQDYPVDLRAKDGSLKHVLVRSSVLWEDGQFIHTRCFIRDVTERLRLEDALQGKLEQLAAADRQKDEFLAMLAHELRNPLAPIRLATTLLRKRATGDVDRYLGMIDRQVDNLTRLVNDLLDVSRITRGKIELRKECLDVATVVSHAIETTRSLMEQHRHQVSVTLPTQPVQILGDPIRLEQVLVNLLVNAAKYTRAEGRITITVALVRDGVELRVRDSGIGITPAMLESIFDLFRQAERSPDRAQSGLGIGLTIARNLVHLHGGSIEARSDGEDRGAEFTVRLPLLPVDDRTARSAQGGPRPYTRRDGLRVLVVDDNADIADTLAELLRDVLGHDVRVAYDGRSAMEMAVEFRPRVILLDIGLPGMDGYELARTLRASGSDALLVAVTGYGQARDRQRAIEAGFIAHLVKPVQIDALMGVLEAADPVRQPHPSDGGLSSGATGLN